MRVQRIHSVIEACPNWRFLGLTCVFISPMVSMRVDAGNLVRIQNGRATVSASISVGV
jgi:hypothetical protein